MFRSNYVFGMIMLFGFAATDVSAKPTPSDHVVEVSATEACQNWISKRAPDSPAANFVVEGGICFDGDINEASAQAFLEAFNPQVTTSPSVIVIKSDGGEVGAALNMADAIANRNVTVIASYKCISSCANYILAAGKHRVVLADTVLLFHGGASLDHVPDVMEGVSKSYADQHLSDPEKNMVKVAIDISHDVQRQDLFLQKVGISRTFFRWMNLFNYMNADEQSKHCDNPNSQIVLFPAQVLAQFGYRIDDYIGPQTKTELLETLRRMNKIDNAKDICVWH